MKGLALALLLLTAVASAIVLLARPGAEASPATYTVNSTADPGDGTCDGTECTLREAIAAANASAGTDTIEFDIPGAGPHTISPGSALPTITDPVIIDGTSEPDFAGTPIVELDGTNAGANGVDGLTITAGDSTVKGLVVNRFFDDGIWLSTNGGNIIEGNYIGTDVGGTADLGNGVAGVFVTSSSNTIGGTAAGTGNVISGNGYSGIHISGSAATGNEVLGNYIGTDKNGVADLGNSSRGVNIGPFAVNNSVGGAAAGAGNVISGNDVHGIYISSLATGNQVLGNYIGTDVTGTADLGNSLDGVHIRISSSSNTIGGTTAGAGNVISGNDQYGVYISESGGNTISGNSIHSNDGKGIELADGGNGEIPPPVIDSVGSVSGHTEPKCYPCTVEVFSDDEDEGRIYHGSTTTNDDATGTWSYPGAVTGPNVTATITDAAGNTSEFSAPVAYSPSPPVGGLAELADASDSSGRNYIAVAALAAAALVALTAGAWYARRRFSRG